MALRLKPYCFREQSSVPGISLGCSQPSVTPTPENLMPSSGLREYCTHVNKHTNTSLKIKKKCKLILKQEYEPKSQPMLLGKLLQDFNVKAYHRGLELILLFLEN